MPCPTARGGEGDRVLSINFSQELERCYQIHEPDPVFTEHMVKLNRIVMDFLRRLGIYSMLWHQDKVMFKSKESRGKCYLFIQRFFNFS